MPAAFLARPESEVGAMGEIAIRLDPGKLANPDADLRYLIPDRIEELSKGKLRNEGYD